MREAGRHVRLRRCFYLRVVFICAGRQAWKGIEGRPAHHSVYFPFVPAYETMESMTMPSLCDASIYYKVPRYVLLYS
jgi:hypothetical protein